MIRYVGWWVAVGFLGGMIQDHLVKWYSGWDMRACIVPLLLGVLIADINRRVQRAHDSKPDETRSNESD